jgi:hypothetical protein
VEVVAQRRMADRVRHNMGEAPVDTVAMHTPKMSMASESADAVIE